MQVIVIASIHVKCLVLEGVLQQVNNEKQAYRADYSNLTDQCTVWAFLWGKKEKPHKSLSKNIETSVK